MAFPTVTATLDDFERADGAPGGDWNAGAALGGAASTLAISDGRLTCPGSGVGDSGFLDTVYGPDVELQSVFNSSWAPLEGDAIVFVARGHDFHSTDWGGVYLVLIGGAVTDTWELRERVGGSASTLTSVTSSRLSPSAGDRIGLEVTGDTVTAYKVRAGVATEITSATTTVTDAGQFGVELSPNSGGLDGVDALVGGTQGDAPAGNTLYVDPGNVAASDAHTYEQAQDPDTPLASWDRALALLQSNDTVNMVDDVTDPDFQFPQLVALSPVLATNVTVQGADDDTPWHVRNVHLRGIDGWTFRNLITHGNTQGDLSELDGCSNMTFVNWEAQRGGANILSALGDWLWDGGSVEAPLDSPATSFLDGVGWRIYVTFESTSGIGNVEFRDFEFSNVQGEDGVQFLAGTHGHDGNTLKFTRCYWHDFTQSDQANAPHTDGVQIIGANHVIFDSPRFEAPMPSMIITSDDYVQHLELINGKFAGNSHGGFSTQFFGCFRITARNCTWDGSGFGGLRVGYDSRLSATNPVDGGDEHLVIDIANCIIDKLGYTEGIDNEANPQAATITQRHNRIGNGPLQETDTQGFAEFGHTDDTTLELANTPAGTNADVIDAGLSNADDDTVPLLDRLGRARKGDGTDLGCHESDPDVEVAVDPRAPRVLDPTPEASETGVSGTTNVTLPLFPRPGKTIDASTVTADSFNLAGPSGVKIPGTLNVGAPDIDNVQNLRLNPTGTLLPSVVYTATATTDIADTEGSELAVDVQWSFTIRPPVDGQPEIVQPDDGGGGGNPGGPPVTLSTGDYLAYTTRRTTVPA